MYQGGWKLPGSKWANPFKVGKHGTIDEVLEQYEAYVRGREDLMGSLEKLRGKVLGCWCKDKPSDKCHGDILIKLLDEK